MIYYTCCSGLVIQLFFAFSSTASSSDVFMLRFCWFNSGICHWCCRDASLFCLNGINNESGLHTHATTKNGWHFIGFRFVFVKTADVISSIIHVEHRTSMMQVMSGSLPRPSHLQRLDVGSCPPWDTAYVAVWRQRPSRKRPAKWDTALVCIGAAVPLPYWWAKESYEASPSQIVQYWRFVRSPGVTLRTCKGVLSPNCLANIG